MMTTQDPHSDRKGEAPDAGELFVAALGLAGLTKTLLERAAAQQDEVARTVRALDESRSEIIRAAESLHAMYAPAEVQRAAAQAERAVERFAADARSVLNDLRTRMGAATHVFWVRTLGAALIAVMGLVGIVIFTMKFVPSADEVQARLAIMAEQPIQTVQYAGGSWVQLSDPKTETLCTNGQTRHCPPYGRVR